MLRVAGSIDPNDKSSTGVGEGGYIDGQGPIEYRIRFENLADGLGGRPAGCGHRCPRCETRLVDPSSCSSSASTDAVIVPPEWRLRLFRVATDRTDPNPVQCEIHLNPVTGELIGRLSLV